MSEGLSPFDSFADLDDVFLHFHSRLEQIPAPRSVAEARITPEELSGLIRWFSDLRKKPRMWSDDPWQRKIENGVIVSNQEMFGALLVILASEICRDTASEEEVWPAVTAVLAVDKLTFRLLFDANRQPGTLCKKALAEGARRLNLRNLIDCSGRQEYVDTLRLQFGFTLRGAQKRLPEWLAGLGRPVAVRILCGEEKGFEHLQSLSFRNLWTTLDAFRKRKIDSEFASAMLAKSPWIRTEWVDQILRVTETSRNRAFAAVSTSSLSEGFDTTAEPICNLTLQWDPSERPRLRLHLNDERIGEILGASSRAQFSVDGAVVGTWVVFDGGQWNGERQLPCEPRGAPPNLRPVRLAISVDGELREEVDLSEFGINDALAIFDIRTGRLVSQTSSFDILREYAFLCDTDLSVPGAVREYKSRSRSIFAVASPWTSDLHVTCDGLVYWRPPIADDTTPPPRVSLVSPPGCIAEPGSESRVLLAGMPEGAKTATLTIGQSEYAVVCESGGWEPHSPIRITAGLALRTERLRIRIDGYSRLVVPRVEIKFRGIACLGSGKENEDDLQWEFLNREYPLNRAGGAGSAKLFVDKPEAWLYEGDHRIARIGTRPLPLRDLFGWGAPLVVRTDNDGEFTMLHSVEDRGAGRFQAPLFKGRTSSAFHWRAPTAPGREHKVLLWADLLREPRILRTDQIESRKDGLVWKLADSGPVIAMAISHQGWRNASFWTEDGMIRALRVSPSAELFALIRWLHLPILSRDLLSEVQMAARKAPVEFVSGWIRDTSLGSGLVHRVGEPGLHTVLRAILWSHVEANEARIEKIASVFNTVNGQDVHMRESEAFRSSLTRMGYICPSLAYSLAVRKMRSDKYKRYVRSAVASMLGLAEGVDMETLRNRLAAVRREISERSGVAYDFLQAGENALAAHMENSPSDYSQFEPMLRRLGETSRGPQFLTASLLMRLTERRRL
jgi:hypothetical protein